MTASLNQSREHISETLPDLSGRIVGGGCLELLELIGTGAFGKVYKARDLSAPADEPTMYAVKCMHQHPRGSPSDISQRTELAAHQQAATVHPGVVRFYGSFAEPEEEMVFVILEYVEGGDLHDLVFREREFCGDPERVRDVMRELLDVVEALHEIGLYHRDLKCDNLLLGIDGAIRVADFGLATAFSQTDAFGCGTSGYMSPESLRESQAEDYCPASSDLWALSVILVNLISGRQPWRKASPKDAAYAAFLEDDDYLRDTLKLTKEANDVLKRCFNSDPARRPSIAQMRDAIEGIELFSFALEARCFSPLLSFDSLETGSDLGSEPGCAATSVYTAESSLLATPAMRQFVALEPSLADDEKSDEEFFEFPDTKSAQFAESLTGSHEFESEDDLNTLAQFPMPPGTISQPTRDAMLQDDPINMDALIALFPIPPANIPAPKNVISPIYPTRRAMFGARASQMRAARVGA
ncbi:Protein kinase domain-containing protein [Mycena kentingensis (nom. inval.)]|nr:Protein kinase domain-containing protein [Mycena kentingensis (nom. inval.)]